MMRPNERNIMFNKISDARNTTVKFVKKNAVTIAATAAIIAIGVTGAVEWAAINKTLARDLQNPNLR